MEQETPKKTAQQEPAESEEMLTRWRNVPGDVDDFIFSVQDQKISER